MSPRVRIGTALASALALAIAAGVPSAQAAPMVETKPAALVNGEPISLTEVDAVAAMLPMAGSETTLTEQKRHELRTIAVGMLIDDVLFFQALHRLPPPDATEVTRRMVELEEGLRQKGRTLLDFCKETGQSQTQIQAKLIAMLQWQTYSSQRIGDDQLKQYYEDSRAFWDHVEVRCSHIALRVAPNATETERQAAYKKLSAIYQELVAGKLDFATAVQRYSECPKEMGGDIGFITRKFGLVDESFARAAFDPRLQIGQITGIVQTEFGYHIIKITDRRQQGEPSSFDNVKVKNKVHELYMEEVRQAMIAAEHKTAKIEINLP